MTSECDVAWELVECVRARLTIAELNNTYVNLGIGEFDAVIQAAMTVVERERLSVPDSLADMLHDWRLAHHPDGAAADRLTRQIAQCRLSSDFTMR
ncbi:MAG: hypothetical protein EKK51_21365 [Mycolicibacterium sp.]|uniref:hypothetical protein n=1 Tax=Mycolicibacterium sp. TaxID=2320850 RepID=UPI00092C4803|nr:hypothetical protein [Mycolicibacterium sp.]RUP29123.1 MAG: hypothetical protein EKK51_21365 [Mycolicibacterium sp.]SHV28786.1 Uncharacterised protein [Mycobacteroides abscessus subsp. abscessus]